MFIVATSVFLPIGFIFNIIEKQFDDSNRVRNHKKKVVSKLQRTAADR